MEASSLSPEICKSNVEARGDLRRPTEANHLPDEVLEQILSWVPARVLVARCSLVCRRWRDLLGRPTLWKRQWERDPDHRAALEAAQRHRGMDWGRVSVLRPLGRNLLKNPRGKEQSKHWSIHFSKSQCFLHRTRRFPRDSQKTRPRLTTCYHWYSKTQVIDLLKEGFWEDLLDTYQPDILISDCWEDHRSTGWQYSIQITLLAADQTSIITEFKFHLGSTRHQNTAGQKEIYHVFRNYGPGVRYVQFWHEGQDSESWMGCFGAQLTNSVVMAKISA
ncbi:hypothetical protein JRQ81_011707 [Phrynocephalus forsythii]|uniref:Uncharacterized protein n=1 Tax=Phrynocephalus forsythii TaxID=171643 RepID=A0A9Q0X8D1_9SAUR|nr:hypothetical protein JRQ81_011707 [Phrynocephalus forsythii]